MKRFISLLAVAVMLPLSSCGSSKKTEDIPMLKWIVPGIEQKDHELVMGKVNEILTEKAGCTVEIQYIDVGVFTERMIMMMSGEDSYDLCFTGYVNPYQKMAEMGGLLPLDDYLDDFPTLKNMFPDYLMESMTIDGSIYAIPNMQIMANCTGLAIDEALFNEYGQMKAEDIKTLNDIEPFLEWVKVNFPEKYPYKTGNAGGLDKKYDYSFAEEICRGVYVKEKDGVLMAVNEFLLEQRLEEAKLAEDWYKKGYIREDVAVVNGDISDGKKYAVWRTVYKPGVEVEYKSNKNDGIICIPITEPVILSNVGRTTMTGVGKNSRHPEKAIKIIELMNTDKELYNLLSFGIEGRHYKFVEDGVIEKIENSGYNPGSPWKYGNQFNAYILKGQEKNVWEETEKINNMAKKSPLIGFEFDKTNVLEEVVGVENVCNKYQAFYKGYLPLDSYYENLLNDLEKAGINKVIEEVDRQIQEFVKNK